MALLRPLLHLLHEGGRAQPAGLDPGGHGQAVLLWRGALRQGEEGGAGGPAGGHLLRLPRTQDGQDPVGVRKTRKFDKHSLYFLQLFSLNNLPHLHFYLKGYPTNMACFELIAYCLRFLSRIKLRCTVHPFPSKLDFISISSSFLPTVLQHPAQSRLPVPVLPRGLPQQQRDLRQGGGGGG